MPHQEICFVSSHCLDVHGLGAVVNHMPRLSAMKAGWWEFAVSLGCINVHGNGVSRCGGDMGEAGREGLVAWLWCSLIVSRGSGDHSDREVLAGERRCVLIGKQHLLPGSD